MTSRTVRARTTGGASEDVEAREFEDWQRQVRARTSAHLRDFLDRRYREHLDDETRVIAKVLGTATSGGKQVRSLFVLVGWLCGAEENPAAVRAAASAELLHCFALVQDDVMDESALRRGAPSAHSMFAQWHQAEGLPGSAQRFGESAAVLAGDLCLVWAGQMLRESGLPAEAVARAAPRYDWMRAELAVGQFRDLLNVVEQETSVERVLSIARAKSGHYTVRRPLELGADLAGCPAEVLGALGAYGDAVGEAFQLRDDVLGVFGDPGVTGKPVGDDLRAGKAVTVVAVAEELATGAQRARLRDLRRAGGQDRLDDDAVLRWLAIIEETGARERVEQLIDQRLQRGLTALAAAPIPVRARAHLTALARVCCDRTR
ncbi:polyprenyl synthetase family protein [Actinokineospora bangkokensis]|uniref:polyprenyl synthetase family protein n=1 Tax=Actinokineospora bangkokensis TaxID=1193682 RepID=UPI000A06F1E3|nr:polyprenyl synthetase family protein [Actinokineospora bangkokensis]